MTSTAKLDRHPLGELAIGPAGSQLYLRQKELAMRKFRNHVTQVELLNFDKVLKNDKTLEDCLTSYFFGIRVNENEADDENRGKRKQTGNKIPPKLGYTKNIKSTLFNVLLKDYKSSMFDHLVCYFSRC